MMGLCMLHRMPLSPADPEKACTAASSVTRVEGRGLGPELPWGDDVLFRLVLLVSS